MKIFLYFRIIFMILAIIAVSFLVPAATALYAGEAFVIPSFVIPMIAVCTAAGILFFIKRRQKLRLSVSGGIILVAAAWIGAGILGALPLYLSNTIPCFADALFESVSGFTTTGATILTDIETCPLSMHVWRTQMHWLG